MQLSWFEGVFFSRICGRNGPAGTGQFTALAGTASLFVGDALEGCVSMFAELSQPPEAPEAVTVSAVTYRTWLFGFVIVTGIDCHRPG